MRLFRWSSLALQLYGPGDILAIGADIEEARTNACKGFDDLIRSQWGWLCDDPDEIPSYEEKRDLLEADIMRDPEEGTVFFITGSE